jgi:hypothetical protein
LRFSAFLIASRNYVVPEWAIVPRLLIKSSLFIPIPVSQMVRVPSAALGTNLISCFFSSLVRLASYKDKNLTLSKASEALEMASLKNTSL